MLNIEIKGVQFSNKGAELMLVAILEQLDKALGEYQITLSPGTYLPYQKRARLGAWQKLSFRRGNIDLTGAFGKLPNKLLNLLKRYGIVTEKDVDVILDASGFAYGEQWGVKSLKHTAKEVTRFQQQGKKYIFLPQALGPFKSREVQQLAIKVFANADLVFPRDDESYRSLTELLSKSKTTHVQQAPDFTCLVEPEPFIDEMEPVLDKQTVCIIPNNKMVSRFHHKKASDDEQSYIDFLVQAGKYYQQEGWNVVLLNHEGKEDQKICQQIAKELSSNSNKVVIKDDLSAVGIKAYIGSVDAVLSSRFHGCVSALTQGIPCLATSWSHKYQMLFQEYGVEQNVLDFKVTASELEQSLMLFTQCLSEQRKQYLKHSACVKETTRHMWQQVFATLKV
ncbi:polysaccharide pyruvyl transferase family protein [Colwellia sp. TT2012]|uniref:polysaccharide pyruvyl transferase family protein n=1 Tax=Colwellia sp. TT2012 TaxID=1720342 RepID=UPI0007093F52|nr:polysaccharide pyruvyl transferase family protein [Colwellia sp. TT2012]